MDKEKVVTIIPDKQVVIDKSDLDFIHKQYKDKIDDLEAKLAESEETIKNNSHNKWLKSEAERYKSEYQSLKGYIDQLKQQLEEKDEKIATLIEAFDARGKEIDALAIVLNRECDACKPNQTAIAELNNILDTFAIFVNEEKESMVSPDGSGNLSLLEYVENRIDTLKGEK